MVTGKSPTRIALAKAAARCFLEQTHREKELIIVNDGDTALGFSNPTIRELMIPSSPKISLGELRNIGLNTAQGELVMQWDDDDWHHPQRMEVQLSRWEPGAAVLLQNQIRCNLADGRGIRFTTGMGIHGTILHQRSENVWYPAWRRREDTWFLMHFRYRIVLETSPSAYVRFWHGTNTWNARHVMGRASTSKPLPQRDCELLKTVLKNYYSHCYPKRDFGEAITRHAGEFPAGLGLESDQTLGSVIVTVKAFPILSTPKVPARLCGALLLLREISGNILRRLLPCRDCESEL